MTNSLQTKDNAEQNLTQEMLPLVSVIMPVYNGAKYIGQAISSVYAQKVPVELIVIDDGSTDNIKEVLQPWQRASMWHFWMQTTGGQMGNFFISCRH